MASKLRAVSMADGRVGWPDVVLYEMQDGRRLLVPPRRTEFPNPKSPKSIPLASAGAAKMIALGELKPKIVGLPYRTIVLDLEAYDKLCAGGWIYSDIHRGPTAERVDQRPSA